MTPIHVADDVARALHKLSERERRTVDDVLRTLIQRYDEPRFSTPSPESNQALLEMEGMFKDEISDMSMTPFDLLIVHNRYR
jgi:tRNA uridine 5-carbamoylmethylation protein Kti12